MALTCIFLMLVAIIGIHGTSDVADADSQLLVTLNFSQTPDETTEGYEDQDLTLNAATDVADAQMLWYFNGNEITHGGRYEITDNSLKIISLVPSDAGVYTVQIVSGDLENTFDTTLTINLKCPLPDTMAHGQIISGEGVYQGETITFVCDGGYSMQDAPDTSICQEDFTWSNEVPECTNLETIMDAKFEAQEERWNELWRELLASMESLNASVITLTSQVQEAERKIETLEIASDTQTTNIGTLNTDIQAVVQSVTDMSETCCDPTNNQGSGPDEEYVAENEAWKTAMDQTVGTLRQDLSELEQEYDEHIEDYNTLYSKVQQIFSNMIAGCSGQITSPFFPSNYEGDFIASYNLVCDEGEGFVIEFKNFSLQGRSGEECLDSLKIYDGAEESDPLVVTLCGEEATVPITTTSRETLIVFETDSTEVASGFKVVYYPRYLETVNWCRDGPCEYGICSIPDETALGFLCTCFPGYAGEVCDEDIDECIGANCGNGQCEDLVNDYVCHCDPGWTGDSCETDIDECVSQPCLNGGQCNNLLNSYSCTCVGLFTGINCEADIDECESTPCLNGGVCYDAVGSYHCGCVHGYYGDHCGETNDAVELSNCVLAVSYASGYATCNNGYLAVGMCASTYDNLCFDGYYWYAVILKCCRFYDAYRNPYDYTLSTNNYALGNYAGYFTSCYAGDVIGQLCASTSYISCTSPGYREPGYWILWWYVEGDYIPGPVYSHRLFCYGVAGGRTVSSLNCYWDVGINGSGECLNQYVLAGTCTSDSAEACWGYSYAIYCCPIS